MTKMQHESAEPTKSELYDNDNHVHHSFIKKFLNPIRFLLKLPTKV